MSEDIVDELNFYAQRAEADEKVLSLLAEAAGTIQRLRIPMSPADKIEGVIARLRRPPYSSPEYVPKMYAFHHEMIAELSKVGIALRAAAVPAPDGTKIPVKVLPPRPFVIDDAPAPDVECTHPWAYQDANGSPFCSACGEPWENVLHPRPAPDAGLVEREAIAQIIETECYVSKWDFNDVIGGAEKAADAILALLSRSGAGEPVAIHPLLAIDVQEHRDAAYKNGWDDGYAEGFGKASATPAVAGEPVAWRWRDPAWPQDGYWAFTSNPHQSQGFEIEPLYATPAPSGRDPAPRWYVRYDGYGQHYKSQETDGLHSAICYDEDCADKISAMLDDEGRDPATIDSLTRKKMLDVLHCYRRGQYDTAEDALNDINALAAPAVLTEDGQTPCR